MRSTSELRTPEDLDLNNNLAIPETRHRPGILSFTTNNSILTCFAQKCTPLALLVGTAGPDNKLNPIQPNSQPCPFCHSCMLSDIQLFPLALNELDHAVNLRRLEAVGKKDSRKESFDDTHAESSYLALSHSHGASGNDSDTLRTGRWTDAEMAYVDFLLLAFEQKKLVIPNGIRLNDFLCEVLLCKPSRLTKKMKNMKLSSKSYSAAMPRAMIEIDYAQMTKLEHFFLESISSEAARVELRFHMTKAWRTFFSNFCLQINSQLLDAREWIASLEDMESRAAEAAETLRQARRKRMGLALKTDMRSVGPGVFFAGMPVVRHPSSHAFNSEESTVNNSAATMAESSNIESSDDTSEADFISNMLDLGALSSMANELSTGVDLATVFENDPSIEAQTTQPSLLLKQNCGPFLERIISFVEAENLPFEHVDVWVPMHTKNEMRLAHAGYVTRHDLSPALIHRLNEYGEYSTQFSFAAGVGLPGRVFNSKTFSWECRVDKEDSRVFERAGGAKVYGVKTGVGIAVESAVIGTMVVALYSSSELPRDDSIIHRCIMEFSKLSPSPRWKLVVEMDENNNDKKLPTLTDSPPGVLQYKSSVSLPTGTVVESLDPHDEENMIATLLGEHMPLSTSRGASSSNDTDLIPHYMSLRLLLLRDTSGRTRSENEMLEIIKKSFRGYSADPSRSPKDVSLLLVRDWQFLRAPAESKPLQSNVNEYKSHLLRAPPVRTHSLTGMPTFAPGPLSEYLFLPLCLDTLRIHLLTFRLGYVDPSTVRRGSDASRDVPTSPKRARLGSVLEDDVGLPFF